MLMALCASDNYASASTTTTYKTQQQNNKTLNDDNFNDDIDTPVDEVI